MAESQPGHIDQIKQTNAGMVYHLIDTLGPVSRIDLSRFTQLAPASITKIVREMLDAHLVQETEIPESGARGRPATGLNVATAGWHYLAVRLGRGDIALALHDLSGAVVIAEIEALSPDIPEQASSLLSRIVRSIDNLFTRNQCLNA